MLESGYYPPGAAFDPNAPWNEVEIPEREFNATISSSLSKSTTIESKDYIIEEDPDGSYMDTSEIRWLEEYKEYHYTPLQLLNLFAEHLKEELKHTDDRSKRIEIVNLIRECEDWVEDEVEVVGE